MYRGLTPLLLLLLLTGCASRLPSGIAEAPVENPAPSEVAANPNAHAQRTVRWGGTIAEVENRAEYTWLVVVGRPLAGNGRPDEGDRSIGRFLARVPGFLDPAIYEAGRQVTVSGPVIGLVKRPVGGYEYTYPEMLAESRHLWEPLPERIPAMEGPYWYSPYWYDPWYHPYRRSHPWPRSRAR
ncbi:Slp family lipoprotein [Alkalilimnicola sp. S0819]|uniref:Slp family lipoprotein n=1 Tax=Alkalilimnicola sp. S0819 TaxID=2613922 RepID=UPI0012625318|nr:Slp family lipoprotein [Alkalilimnicola sp. S0819]KAB7628325.1 Slp/YeaY family lipoprotein [Alkalilimnicola sp. S0819]MPQ15223.1 Slp/YeaY family lipoprotein [Alkalilimnicola sp. S0819]